MTGPVPEPASRPLDRQAVYVLGALVVIVIGGYILLTALNRDPAPYMVFVSGPLVTAVVGALMVKRTAGVAADVAEVRHATNSALTAQFEKASAERAANEQNRATAAEATPTANPEPPVVTPTA